MSQLDVIKEKYRSVKTVTTDFRTFKRFFLQKSSMSKTRINSILILIQGEMKLVSPKIPQFEKLHCKQKFKKHVFCQAPFVNIKYVVIVIYVKVSK